MIVLFFLGWLVCIGALALFLKLAKDRNGYCTVLGLSVVLWLLALPLASIPLLMQMTFTFLVALACIIFNPPRAVAATLMVGAVMPAIVWFITGPLATWNQMRHMRVEYPLESIASRLDYETQHQRVSAQSPPIELSPVVARNLDQFDGERDRYNLRTRRLEGLHDSYQQQFILATGFGPGRMMSVFPGAVDVEDDGPILLDSQAIEHQEGSAAAEPQVVVGDPLPGSDLLTGMHKAGLTDFLDPGRMGYVRDRDHVAGFELHRFTRLPKPVDDPHRPWRLSRLELIGLLKYDRPKAYVSENLPRLDELGEGATREIDDFERSALERLQSEEDLVIDDTRERIRMLGSLRAGKDCLQCHDVQRGQLIGALSYEILTLGDRGTVATRD